MSYIGNAPSQGLVTGGGVVDGSIETVDIKDKAITAAKLGDTAIADKLGYTPQSAAQVAAAIAALVNSAPSALDTLKELSDALGADANFATTVTNALAGKVNKSGDTLTGALQSTAQDTTSGAFKAKGNKHSFVVTRTEEAGDNSYVAFGVMDAAESAWKYRINKDGTENLYSTKTVTMNGAEVDRVDTAGNHTKTYLQTFSSGYADAFTHLAPNIGAGGKLSLGLGKSTSTKNLAKMVFDYQGSGSDSNKLSFGFFDSDGLLQIDAVGRVIMPYQPAFEATSPANTFTPSSVAGADYTQIIFNRGGHYNSSNGRFTAPVAGVYYFFHQASARNVSSSTYEVKLFKNTSIELSRVFSNGAGYNHGAMAIAIIALAAGDYVQAGFYNGAGVLMSGGDDIVAGNGAGIVSGWGGYLLG